MSMVTIPDQEVGSSVMFSHCLGIGPMSYKRLLSHFGSATDALHASIKDLAQLLSPKIVEQLEQYRNITYQQRIMERIVQKKITVLIQSDKRYPAALLQITDPPICLYVRGSEASISSLNSLSIAIVGTRKPSEYGSKVTENFASYLVKEEVVIVSGLALGIDSVAHQVAVDLKGRTVAVLGCGVDVVYPPEHIELYNKIQATGGLIVSEFPPGQTVQKGLFVARNRIISGLSRGVLVVEGEKHSGTLITARYAAEQGRDVFAIPGSIFSPLSQAPHLLLHEGAHLVTEPSQILSLCR